MLTFEEAKDSFIHPNKYSAKQRVEAQRMAIAALDKQTKLLSDITFFERNTVISPDKAAINHNMAMTRRIYLVTEEDIHD